MLKIIHLKERTHSLHVWLHHYLPSNAERALHFRRVFVRTTKRSSFFKRRSYSCLCRAHWVPSKYYFYWQLFSFVAKITQEVKMQFLNFTPNTDCTVWAKKETNTLARTVTPLIVFAQCLDFLRQQFASPSLHPTFIRSGRGSPNKKGEVKLILILETDVHLSEQLQPVIEDGSRASWTSF